MSDTIATGDLVDIENQNDSTWTGPYEVVDHGLLIDFFTNGRTKSLYLQPVENAGPGYVDYPVNLVHAHRATRHSDGLIAFRYPRALCRLARP